MVLCQGSECIWPCNKVEKMESPSVLLGWSLDLSGRATSLEVDTPEWWGRGGGKGNELLCKRNNLCWSWEWGRSRCKEKFGGGKRRKEYQNFVGGGTVVSEFLVGVNCVLFCSFWMVVNRLCLSQSRGMGRHIEAETNPRQRGKRPQRARLSLILLEIFKT